MLNFNNFFTQGVSSTLRLKPGTNWSYKGQWIQIYEDTEIDRWYVGDFSSASYQITVEFNSNKKEVLNALVIARPDEASVVITSRVSIDDDLITLSATVNDSYLSLVANPSDPSFEGAKVIFLATYTETMHDLTVPAEKTYLPSNDPNIDPLEVGEFGGGGSGSQIDVSLNINDLIDVSITSPISGQALLFNGAIWTNSNLNLSNYATLSSPAFSGSPTAPTASQGTSNTQIATTAFVQTAVNNLIDAAPSALNTLNELAAALNDDNSFATTITNSLALKANISSPAFTGVISSDGIYLGAGATITEFSNDTTLSSASSTKVPTQAAVKAYADNLQINSNNSNLTGTTTIQQTSEVLNTLTLATGTVIHDFSQGAIWVHSNISSGFAANFTNVPTTNNRTSVATVILLQGSTPYSVTSLQINSLTQTINWLNGTVPSVSANRKEIYSFALVRSSNSWTVFGSLTSYG